LAQKQLDLKNPDSITTGQVKPYFSPNTPSVWRIRSVFGPSATLKINSSFGFIFINIF